MYIPYSLRWFSFQYTHSWIHLMEFEVHKIERMNLKALCENICVILIVPTSFRWMCWLLTSCKFMRNRDNNFKYSHLKNVHALYFLLALFLMLVSVCALSNGFTHYTFISKMSLPSHSKCFERMIEWEE